MHLQKGTIEINDDVYTVDPDNGSNGHIVHKVKQTAIAFGNDES